MEKIMLKTRKKYDFTKGPIFWNLFKYTIPLMLTSTLQVFYNMADHAVVGKWSGNPLALAAVGSTTSMTSLLVNLMVGIATGAGVIVAQSLGARDNDTLSRTVHTSISFAAILGLAFSLLGLVASRGALTLIGTKTELMPDALLYVRIICLGIPATAIYNFSAAILRSVGDSKTPLKILSASGIINVLLNIFLVTVCHMSVGGVALATITSQYVSAFVVIRVLVGRRDEVYALKREKLGIDLAVLGRIIRYGLPAGIQSSLFSISNVIITSGINQLATASVSAKTILMNSSSLIYNAMNSYLHASMTATAQNFGAKKNDRIRRTLGAALLQVIVVGIVYGQVLLFFSNDINSLFIAYDDPNREIILNEARGLAKMLFCTYFICGMVETTSGALRGLGHSILPMLISLFGIAGLRAGWILFGFPMERFHNLVGAYYAYPISWIVTFFILITLCITTWIKLGILKIKKETV